jgi:alcohol dehydrogenase
MQAYRYTEMLRMISTGKLAPERLIGDRISLDESIAALVSMNDFSSTGITVITQF